MEVRCPRCGETVSCVRTAKGWDVKFSGNLGLCEELRQSGRSVPVDIDACATMKAAVREAIRKR